MSLSPSFSSQVVEVFPQVWIQQVSSLSCSLFLSPLWCGFLIQDPKMVNHSCLTAVLSHTGHCPLPLPVILVSVVRWCSQLLLLFLSWRGKQKEMEVWGGIGGLVKRQKKRERAREAERECICQNSSKTLGEAEKAAGSCSWSRWSECVR